MTRIRILPSFVTETFSVYGIEMMMMIIIIIIIIRGATALTNLGRLEFK
jgi:hypothetical protein